jgi:hypothetical protein
MHGCIIGANHIRVVGITVSGRQAAVTRMALTAVIALEHNHPVADREIGAVDDIHYGANALMPEVLRVIMKFKVMFCPDARTLETDRRDLSFDIVSTVLTRDPMPPSPDRSLMVATV